MADQRAIRSQAALLIGAVLLVALNWEISDIGVIRWRETVGDTDFEYPALARVIYLAERAITGSVVGISVVNAVLAVAFACLVTVVLRRAGADAAMWSTAPTMLLVGQNIDGLTALLIALACVAWQQQRGTHAGLAIGVGTALKVSPLAVIPALVGDGRSPLRPRVLLVAAAGVSWAVINVPYALASPAAWAFPYEFASTRDDVRGTLWAATPLRGDALNAAATLAGAAVLLAVLVAVARRRITPLTGAALSILGFVATNKVWQPHYLLWLLPVLALLHTPRRPVRALEAANLAFFLSFHLKLSDERSGTLYWVTGAARFGLALAVVVVLLRGDPLVRARSGTRASARPLPGPS